MGISALLLFFLKPRITIDCVFSGLLVLAALFAIVCSMGIFCHYPIFLITPSLLFFIIILQTCSHSNTGSILNYFQKNKNTFVKIKLVLKPIGAIMFIFCLLFLISPVRYAIITLGELLLQHSPPVSIWHTCLIILSLGGLIFLTFAWFLAKIAEFPFVLNICKQILKNTALQSYTFWLCVVWLLIFSESFSNISTQTILSNKNMLVGNDKKSMTQLSRIVMARTDADDCIVVWGREPRIYIYANRQSATAQCEIDRLFHVVGHYPPKNIDLYIAGIKKNKPRLIVDIVAPGSYIYTAEKQALENRAEVWGAIKDDYELTDIYPVEGGSYKIYTRKDNKIEG
jgi:hypothetical protein